MIVYILKFKCLNFKMSNLKFKKYKLKVLNIKIVIDNFRIKIYFKKNIKIKSKIWKFNIYLNLKFEYIYIYNIISEWGF